MAKKSQSKIQLSILALALLLSISAAYQAYAASFSSTVTNPPTAAAIVQAGINQTFNFSVNNTDSAKNVTQVRITLPSGFSYVSGSNGTSAAGTSLGGGNWTPSGESQALWQYRKAITINGSTSGQADYRSGIAV